MDALIAHLGVFQRLTLYITTLLLFTLALGAEEKFILKGRRTGKLVEATHIFLYMEQFFFL